MNEQTKHTPGPWHAAFAGCASTPDWTIHPGKTYKQAIEEKPVCFLPETTTKTAEEVSANAALIAQAPDLLRQRDKLREVLRNLFHDWATLVGQDLRENNADVQKLWRETEAALNETEAKT